MADPWEIDPPGGALGTRIVTLLDYIGPLGMRAIATEFDERPDVTGSALATLQAAGYVRVESSLPFVLWESTGLWAPDPRNLVDEV